MILKGGNILDALNTCKNVAFDKTGTLTTGELELISIDPMIPGISEKVALQIAASLEKNAVHPIAKAILHEAKNRDVSFVSLENFRSEAGFGLQAIWHHNGEKILCAIGHAAFIEKLIPLETVQPWRLAQANYSDILLSSAFLMVGNSFFVFLFKDTVRPQAKQAISWLHKLNKKVVMLTGDRKANAELLASEVGITYVYSDLRPEDKLHIVSTLAQEGGVAMLGDGINDAPALTRATVGISMGEIGSATAVDASDIVFLKDDLSLLDWLFTKSHQTLKIVRQNLVLSLGVILLTTTPALGGVIPLWLAVILHEGGTVLVGLNSLRLLRS